MSPHSHFTFARRTDWPRQANALNQALEELKAQGVAVADLTASNPTECGFAYPQDLLSALSSPANLVYRPDACGMEEARRAVARYYARQNVPAAAHNVVLTASTSEAYTFLMRLLVNPGEKVLVPKPSYPLFQFLLEINDVAFDYYPLRYHGRWQIDMDALEEAMDDRTRAVILVNPNNPTGSYLSAGEVNGLNELCRKRNAALISDEVFFDYAFDRRDIASCAGNHGVLTFVLGGLSKSLGLPQMKCSWILASGPESLLEEAASRLEIIADTYLSVNTPVQNALGAWLGDAKIIQEEIISRVRENYEWLCRELGRKAPSASVLSFQGGWYSIVRLPAVKTEEEWVLDFLRLDHVSVYPGYFFDFEGGTHIVMSLLPPPDTFRSAAGRILQRIAGK